VKDERSGAKKKSYERKNARAHDLYVKRNQEKNAKRPKQRYVAGVSWIREDAIPE